MLVQLGTSDSEDLQSLSTAMSKYLETICCSSLNANCSVLPHPEWSLDGGENLDIWQYWAAPLCFSLRWQWGQGLHRQLTVWHFNINVTFNLFLLSQTKVTHQNYSKNKPSKGKFHRFVKGRSFWYTRRATSHKVVLAGLRPTHHQTPILLSVLQTHQASKGRFCHTAPIHQNINYMQRFLVLNSQ